MSISSHVGGYSWEEEQKEGDVLRSCLGYNKNNEKDQDDNDMTCYLFIVLIFILKLLLPLKTGSSRVDENNIDNDADHFFTM